MRFVKFLSVLLPLLAWVVFSGSLSAESDLLINKDLRSWLENQQRAIKVGVAIIPPYLTNQSEDQVEGISIDFLRAIEERLDTRFEYTVFDSYGQLMDAARQREVDIVFAASETPERKQFLDFTPTYSYLANKIFTRKDHYKQAVMADFNGRRFAVPKGTALVPFIRKNYPLIDLLEVDDLREAFSLLAAGEVEGVGSYASAGYLYSVLEGHVNIGIVGDVGYDYHIAFASRNDWPELQQLLTLSLNTMSAEQRESIEQQWVRPEDVNRIELDTVKEILFYLGFTIVVSALLIVIFWNRSLKQQMAYRQEAQKEINFLAYHDELTGAYNRQYFGEVVAEFTRLEFCEQETTCLILLGLNNFRLINDFHGQKIGDYVLKRTVERLQSRLPSSAVLSRTGGDEFAVLMRHSSNRVELGHLADLLIAEISLPIAYGDQSFVTSATAGIAVQNQSFYDPMRLLENADLALHEAKLKNSGSFMLYTDELNEQLLEERHLINAIRDAINTDQFFLHFQPQVSLSEKKVVGFEALARWQHPEKGFIPPDRFIPLAEKEGMIVTLGDRVLQLACEQGGIWLKQGMAFERLAVNVSVKQFIEPDFASKVINVLSQTGFPAEKLELEITESLFLSNKTTAMDTMSKLSSQGVCFAIDDFGTGFSSLLYLKDLPVSKIKLDRGFIHSITEDHSSLQIVKASLNMGHALNMVVIAEGVESPEECALLETLDCDQAQGYLFSKPLPAEQITSEVFAGINTGITSVIEP